MTAPMRNNQLSLLASRVGYNVALRHFRMTQELAANVADGFNLADMVNAALEDERIARAQVRPVVSLLLVDKYGYACRSENLKFQVESIDKLSKAVAGWTNIQVVFARADSDDGIHLLNPESPAAWGELLPFGKDSHLVCYAGSLEDVDKNVLESAVSDVFMLLRGDKVRSNSAYRASGKLKRFPEEDSKEEEMPDRASRSVPSASAPPRSTSGRKLTAKVAVNVTNELFHNGNVEAWKRIIESYRLKHPNLDVLIWYEGERINDINALFKWGKVKHGVPIMFSVSGDNPSEISKLRKYLFEGASPRFEAFLHGGPGSVLNLF